MSRKGIEIQYDEIALADLVDFFVRGYQKDRGTITTYDWFIDPVKGKAIIKLYIERGAGGGR